MTTGPPNAASTALKILSELYTWLKKIDYVAGDGYTEDTKAARLLQEKDKDNEPKRS